MFTGRVSDGLLKDVAARIPPRHLEFIANLPILLELPRWLFVHAGIRPGVPLTRQNDEDLIWIREPFLTGHGLRGYRVVHGHTPVDEPEETPFRSGIDTQCYATGRLTALRIKEDGETRFFTVQS
jgi:serine/threonine protein phosphatase 1